MEKSRSSSICIPCPPAIDDYHNNIEDPCTFEETEKWQELEQFWGDEKHRLQDFDNALYQLSSSLERHLLFDDCINKPEPEEVITKAQKDESNFSDLTVVKGEDINDIPTSYVLNGFKPKELIVIGTYIDPRIIPGFKYKIRKNLTNKHLFGGKALCLEQIGLGYGKRLTFESPCLNKNKNYFWSDSCTAGFGFILEAISLGDTFLITDPVSDEHCGHIIITKIEDQTELNTIFEKDGKIKKTVSVQFFCDAILNDSFIKQNFALNEVYAAGSAELVKENLTSKAVVKSIYLKDFIIKNCKLTPDD